jgi:ABC-type glycerol-3-phosphate transport system substrate-binding protein
MPKIETASQFADDPMIKIGMPPVPDRPIKVELINPWGETQEWFEPQLIQGVIERYYPNFDVDVQYLDSGPPVEMIQTKLIAGEPPTAACPGGSYVIVDWVKAGHILDVSEYWKKYGLDKLVSTGIQSGLMFDGEYYGVGLDVSQSNILWWNKNVFKEVGSKEPPYKSWDEFFGVADQFKAKADVPFWADGLNPPWYELARSIGLTAEKYGVDIYERITNGEATREDFKTVLEWNARLNQYANKDFPSTDSIM